MVYWLESMLAATPAFMWIYAGVGLPWALALLPRRDWSARGLVLALAFACGPGWLTAWMLALGTVGTAANPLLRLDLIAGGTLGIALVGAGLAWRKRHPDPTDTPAKNSPLYADEKLLIALIIGACAVRWLVIAYWPFTAFDALWVYGYQGRLYTLLGYIPTSIDYYPQFLQLQYAYGQLALGGAVDDHAARAVLPFLNAGSILAAYALGSRLFTRRVGLIAAAMWTLYPHMGEWSRFGDLEIPQTFAFTLAATFFLMAWTSIVYRRRYALIAGLMLGVALWIKPTAGAFVWGVLLLLVLDLIRVRFNWQAWRPRFMVAFWTGLACIPLGGVWYVRNLLLGHNPIDFPTDFWLTQASRSGSEFGWPLLALVLVLALVYIGPGPRTDLRRGLIGLALVLAALLPTLITTYNEPTHITAHRLNWGDWLLLALGGAFLLITLLPLAGFNTRTQTITRKVGWALALALPYFITWFYSYSYHFRLSFAIVPLLILPSAVIIGYWLTPQRLKSWPLAVKGVYGAALILLVLPGIVNPLHDTNAGWDWLWTDALPDDMARYQSGNDALMNVVEGFNIYLEEHDTPPVVVAPGIVRLPFFFPTADIRTEVAPTRFDELDGVNYLVYGSPESDGAYAGIPLQANQVVSAFARTGTTVPNIMRRAWGKDDGIFRYQVYELNLDHRFVDPEMFHDPDEPVVFGDFARYRGHGIGGSTFWPGRQLIMQIYWQAIAPADQDYTIFVHLRDADGQVWATWDGPIVSPEFQDGISYSTRVWEPGEFIVDERRLTLPADAVIPSGDDYSLWLGFYDLQTLERLPVTVAGEPTADGYRINERVSILAEAPQ